MKYFRYKIRCKKAEKPLTIGIIRNKLIQRVKYLPADWQQNATYYNRRR